MNMAKEEIGTVQIDSMWDANISYITSRACRTDCLHHRLLGADAFEYGIRANPFCQVLDTVDTFVASLTHDVGGSELAGELLPGRVAAHRDNPLRTHLL